MVFPEVEFRKENKVSETERKSYYYPVVIQYLENVLSGKGASVFFEKYRMEKVVLYAANELAKLLCMDMAKCGEADVIEYLCDRDYSKFVEGFCGKEVNEIQRLKEDYKSGKVKKIIICNLSYEQDIRRALVCVGIAPEDILSIVDIVFDAAHTY